mgnify:CR=1 FL=1
MHHCRHPSTLVMSVEIRQLRALVAIVVAGTFTDAAIDLGISQAAVSRTLAALESELGVRLLRRTTSVLTGWVPAASVIERMGLTRTPVVVSDPTSPAAQAYRDLWWALDGVPPCIRQGRDR